MCVYLFPCFNRHLKLSARVSVDMYFLWLSVYKLYTYITCVRISTVYVPPDLYGFHIQLSSQGVAFQLTRNTFLVAVASAIFLLSFYLFGSFSFFSFLVASFSFFSTVFLLLLHSLIPLSLSLSIFSSSLSVFTVYFLLFILPRIHVSR